MTGWFRSLPAGLDYNEYKDELEEEQEEETGETAALPTTTNGVF
jgi:hypothetical protein